MQLHLDFVRNFKFTTLIFNLTVLSNIVCSTAITALPTGSQVVQGDASVTVLDANSLNINQVSDRAIINWQSFNISPQEKVHFQQPINGAVLNRIDAASGMSDIAGQLTATGRIFLINGAGIMFSDSAAINVGGLIASATDIADANFFNNKLIFDQGNATAAIINEASIKVEDLAVLFGSNVVFEGLIQANAGHVVLSSGQKMSVDFHGTEIINFAVEPTVESAVDRDGTTLTRGVDMSGQIINDGGLVLLGADAVNGLFDNLINMSGEIRAKSTATSNGSITLIGGDTGEVNITGTMNIACTLDTGPKGSRDLQVYGKKIIIDKHAILDASGYDDGDFIDIGQLRKFQVDDTKIPATDSIYVGPDVVLDVSSKKSGRGGYITLEARKEIKFDGTAKIYGSGKIDTATPSNFVYSRIGSGGSMYVTALNEQTLVDINHDKIERMSKDGTSKGNLNIETAY